MPLNPGHISMGRGIRNHETGEYSCGGRWFDTLEAAREHQARREAEYDDAMERRYEDAREREMED